MNSTNRDYLPENYEEIVARFRKVIPPILKPEDLSGRKSSAGHRQLNTGLAKYQGDFGKTEKLHLLRRCLFGVRQADLQALDNLSLTQVMDLLLTESSEPAPPVNNYSVLAEQEDPDVAFGDTWIHAPHAGDLEGGRIVSLKGWVIRNMHHQATRLEEKMVLFWHNLLPVKIWDVFYGKLGYQYYQMLRRNAFGNYRTFIRDLTLDPAMLLFLNGTYNEKEAPDENYGRELQELFCIGKGPDAQFTEGDVQAAARVLTGWKIKWQDFESNGPLGIRFADWAHDTSDKAFSAFYGGKVIKGRSGQAGAQELDELLNMLFDTEECAKYICRRLYQFFVYPEIDESVEANIIVPLAQQFREGNYEIKPVVRTLLESEHFYDHANRGAMIKSPAEYTVGLWRTLEVEGADTSDLSLDYQQYASMLWTMGNQGMEMGDPPSVSGWPAYYQVPSYDKYWITTDTITNRALISDSLVHWGFWVAEGHQYPADLIKFLQQLDHPEDPNAMLRDSGDLLLGISLSDATLVHLKTILLSGQQTDDYWTTAWYEMVENPEDTAYRMVVENRLKPTFQHLLQLGEAQLM
ncbi:DUF1800 domain-containing protein [Marinoscillum furvescens]|uniref:Uncharacterized protein (DUF1800 family) n=1 Tax=Marinoscillum furvescens DSM 4134 TaxID=1122208 RepID=A0A3D9L8T4_MARFU|nr:DUF1800 domain-containing protein [Marinoscillum furvescens]REE01287.1 uncharacterized protein (DUF1800 family) [Marinoscillum furvescens DSM 4134]